MSPENELLSECYGMNAIKHKWIVHVISMSYLSYYGHTSDVPIDMYTDNIGSNM